MTDTLHILCPHCEGVNRVPQTRLTDNPTCGKCHMALFTGAPINLTDGGFSRYLRYPDMPMLVDFWAEWCGPCKMMAPQFQQAAQMLEPRVRLAKVNTEDEQGLSARFGIRSIPTLILFRDGREIARQPGAMGAQDIVRWTASHLG